MPNQVVWMTASAGAGKTTVLVNRYVELLRTHKPEHIICITFTINAAHEMQERIEQHLRNAPVEDGESISNKMRIQTIHSLCHQILSTYTGKNVHILDPYEKALLIQQALRMALDEPTELTEKLAERFSFYHLQNVVEKIFEKFHPNRHSPPSENPGETPTPIDPRLRGEENKALLPDQTILTQLKDHPLTEQLSTNYIDVFLTQKGEIRKRILDAATAKKLPHLVAIMAEEAQRIYEWQQQQAVQEWLYDNALVQALVERVLAYYITLKQDQKDYDELLAATQNLLEDDVKRYDISRNIHHVLLDEAQDTNPKQWRIIELLTQHLFDDPTSSKSFFVVGDHKQSIYGFQDASPAFMKSQKRKYKTLAGEGFIEQTLETNYRCVKAICDYVEVQCKAPTMNIARSHEGHVVEVNDFDETLAKFLNDRPFLPSQNRPLELQDIMILCRKRDKTYKSIIEKYGDQVRYEQTQLLSEVPDIQYLMHAALLMGEADNGYARYKIEQYTSSQINPPIEKPLEAISFGNMGLLDLIMVTLQHNPTLSELMTKFITQNHITTPKALYWWLREYPYHIKTVSTDNPNTMHLLTMHGAKGLQAPVVFVFNEWTPYYQQDIWWSHDTGEFVLPPSKAIHHPTLSTIRDQNTKHQTTEDERLRYVAFTRAMDVLVVIGGKSE